MQNSVWDWIFMSCIQNQMVDTKKEFWILWLLFFSLCKNYNRTYSKYCTILNSNAMKGKVQRAELTKLTKVSCHLAWSLFKVVWKKIKEQYKMSSFYKSKQKWQLTLVTSYQMTKICNEHGIYIQENPCQPQY